MFLYARLVMDYIATNIFYDGDEIKQSVNQLPKKLGDLYVFVFPVAPGIYAKPSPATTRC